MDSLKKILERDEGLRRQVETLTKGINSFEINPGLQKVFDDIQRHNELMRAALGPLEELRRNGLFERHLRLANDVKAFEEHLAQITRRFQLPEFDQTAKLLSAFENSDVRNALQRYDERALHIQQAIGRMRTPWLDVANQLKSVQAFTELQGIGHVLNALPAFDNRLVDAIRVDLGDWRSPIKFPEAIFDDVFARTSFYTAQGLDPNLTAFPLDAFDETLTIAGLKTEAVSPAKLYYRNVRPEPESTDEEAGFQRTNNAHDRLQRFESQLRKFIDGKMRETFGEDWIKHQVPGEVRQAWTEKRQKAQDSGEGEWPLIAYCDFTDYVRIITRKDNWEKVFEPVFRRRECVQESFQRLYPIRVCTMHARVITQDDELYMHVEVKRLLSAIKNKP